MAVAIEARREAAMPLSHHRHDREAHRCGIVEASGLHRSITMVVKAQLHSLTTTAEAHRHNIMEAARLPSQNRRGYQSTLLQHHRSSCVGTIVSPWLLKQCFQGRQSIVVTVNTVAASTPRHRCRRCIVAAIEGCQCFGCRNIFAMAIEACVTTSPVVVACSIGRLTCSITSHV